MCARGRAESPPVAGANPTKGVGYSWMSADRPSIRVVPGAGKWRSRSRGSSAGRSLGLDRNLVDPLGRVPSPFVDALDGLGIRRFRQAEDHTGGRIGPSVLEVHLLLILDGKIRVVGL